MMIKGLFFPVSCFFQRGNRETRDQMAAAMGIPARGVWPVFPRIFPALLSAWSTPTAANYEREAGGPAVAHIAGDPIGKLQSCARCGATLVDLTYRDPETRARFADFSPQQNAIVDYTSGRPLTPADFSKPRSSPTGYDQRMMKEAESGFYPIGVTVYVGYQADDRATQKRARSCARLKDPRA